MFAWVNIYCTSRIQTVCKQFSSAFDAGSVQAMFKLCASTRAWTLLEHCLHTACTRCLNIFFLAWTLLERAWSCWIAQVCHPPPCSSNDQASLILLDFCLILIQAVIKQWKNCKKSSRSAWFCLIIAWFCLIIGLFVVIVLSLCDVDILKLSI